jgi:hypothetical protein
MIDERLFFDFAKQNQKTGARLLDLLRGGQPGGKKWPF